VGHACGEGDSNYLELEDGSVRFAKGKENRAEGNSPARGALQIDNTFFEKDIMCFVWGGSSVVAIRIAER
jgi:hypothetical protein